MTKNTLKVPSADGMELDLDIAELGSRSYAFILDWHFRLLLSLAWLLGAWLLMTGAGEQTVRTATVDTAGHWLASVFFLPPLLIYAFYHPVLEIIMGGRTPGKRMAGVRLVSTSGQTPGVAAILIRNLFRLVDSLPVFYVVGCSTCLATKMQVASAIWRLVRCWYTNRRLPVMRLSTPASWSATRRCRRRIKPCYWTS